MLYVVCAKAPRTGRYKGVGYFNLRLISMCHPLVSYNLRYMYQIPPNQCRARYGKVVTLSPGRCSSCSKRVSHSRSNSRNPRKEVCHRLYLAVVNLPPRALITPSIVDCMERQNHIFKLTTVNNYSCPLRRRCYVVGQIGWDGSDYPSRSGHSLPRRRHYVDSDHLQNGSIAFYGITPTVLSNDHQDWTRNVLGGSISQVPSTPITSAALCPNSCPSQYHCPNMSTCLLAKCCRRPCRSLLQVSATTLSS